ncbi:MAG: hypothetical protein AAGK97_05215 [Bacteroidota bacterium]
MFTINIYLKFAIIAACLIGGTILAITVSFWYALPVLLIGIGFLISYFLLGTVQSAATFMQTMEFEKAEERLKLTWMPNLLYKTNRAYYYLTKGTIAMNTHRASEAEEWFSKAEALELPTDNEKAMVKLQLASINANRGNWTAAKNFAREIKDLKITEPQIKAQVEQFQKAMKNQGQMKAARHGNRGQTMRPGGKRRRPRMR